ncbi:Re/Si-specific NAD(P)(+) transhydrogenase subunit alpha [Bythopirellula polymerisocia]|uniref:NAD(P) transhydrogenase subunit alpha part 1 n=1 Tax=Bythopirellula polymerisocia TaxID=2528003 RepID=A0A5C6CXK5_9BACT|nr:Re/Si-specific NAD(P)(+) transhydrogenase subunit alpha [Bythopirellula polymerisocia]TWU28201.1 NAD(P) transhydrogenase subunit alpha part 1 [Bythopirellula polymerisocia]
MKVAVLRETYPGENRVALVPDLLAPLIKAGWQVIIETGAGVAAGFPDADYQAKGAEIVPDRQAAYSQSDVILQVRCLGANPEAGRADLDLIRRDQVLVGCCDPLGKPQAIQELAERGAIVFAMELIPRITRAQSMDVLSSMATIAGYKSVLKAADHLPKMFPMLMTAAGTLVASKVLVIGAGVAGLQAIASSRRLGAIVQAYDVRPVVKEQIESLGAKFVELNLDTAGSEDKGGYAKELSEDQVRRQQEQLADVIADCDVCISTAAIPGRPSPLLITEDAVKRMRPGSVIVDLAAERGGNCCLSQPDQTVVEHGVTILGPTNLPAGVPQHASQMYAKNLVTFLLLMTKAGELEMDQKDEIIRDTLVAKDGQVQNSRLRGMLGQEPLVLPPASPPVDHLASES